ncbi:Trimethyllysine dioxygenase [Auriscalpium vulgare]|uniref:Trimethyllysine dioxygenase n=1 Tax=Auriscalpium vulgare TaxID=40419 RepID=A0ACB8RZA1_9AGAM|nr:Trimethyllysine dioxygenase [Auriscalpium vulgare]
MLGSLLTSVQRTTARTTRTSRLQASTRFASSSAALKAAEPIEIDAVPSHHLPTSNANEKEVFIHWDGGDWSKFHNIWLRDHCRCSECFHSVTKQRLVNTFEIPPDIEPVAVESKPEGLQVTWPAPKQHHVSMYPWSWLRQSSYDPPAAVATSEKVLWGSKIVQDPPTVPYDEVMAPDNHGLYKWLSRIDKFGFCFVSGVPSTAEATEELSNRIGFIRETHYGKFWDFTADLARGDTAYTNLALPAHTDNTYFTDPCGIQLFHLLSHTDGAGGATLLVDGFYVASILKELHPDVYALLARVPVTAHAAGEDDILYRATRPVLEHAEATGALRAVRWNNDDRSVVRGVPASSMLQWYDALRTWNKLLTSQDSEYWVQLAPGTAIAIDNHRVLHGRSAFTGKRRMCGAYIGADEYRSKLAVLSERFADASAHTEPRVRTVWSPGF